MRLEVVVLRYVLCFTALVMGLNGRDGSCSPLDPYTVFILSPYVTILMLLMGSQCLLSGYCHMIRKLKMTRQDLFYTAE